MSTECSRETSLRLTISQAVFFFFSSVLFPSSTFWHSAQRIQMSTLFIIIQYDFSDLLSILCGVFTKGKNDRIDKLLTPCKYLEIQHKGTKKTLSRWFCFTIYSFQFDRVIEVNFYQIQSFITITVLFLSKNLTWMQCVLKQNIAEMSLDMS